MDPSAHVHPPSAVPSANFPVSTHNVAPTTLTVTLPPKGTRIGVCLIADPAGNPILNGLHPESPLLPYIPHANRNNYILSIGGIKPHGAQGAVNAFLSLQEEGKEVSITMVLSSVANGGSAAAATATSNSKTYAKKVSSYSSSDQEEKKEDDNARRSGRKRKSTTMIIQGQVVKTANNYVLKGDTYSFGAFQPDQKKIKKIKVKKDEGSKPSVPRQRAAYMDEKQKHNDIIKRRVAEDEKKRLNFMTNNYDAIEPFLDDKVKRILLSNKHVAKPEVEKTTVLGSQPDVVTTTLRDYQMIGLDWMSKMHKKGMAFILGDEMGLGKTLQTIALMAHLKEHNSNFDGPSLVICPLSVIYSWCNEVQKHAPSLKYFRFHSSDPKDREIQKNVMVKEVLKYDVVITTYEMVKNPTVGHLFRSTHFNLCVLDEGHVIKSLETDIAQAVRKIHCQSRVILTGTPLQNNLVELYAILNYLYPEFFTTPDAFESAFDIGHNQIDPQMLLKANRMLKLFMIRRLKYEVESLMPKKIETKIICPLSANQIFIYKGFLMNEAESLVKMMEDDKAVGGNRALFLKNLVIQLRKVCLHPYLFDFAEPDISRTGVEELIASSGKLAVLDKLLISMFKNGHRTCIFSQFTSMLDILEDYCFQRGWKYCRFDGGTPRAQRNHLINQFNAPRSDDFIFLMSTRSGGLGINLQTADTCILYDSDWNPQPDLQAMARVHRIGQKKTVHIYRLVSGGTVEERILERAQKKLYLDQMVNSGTCNQNMDDKNGSSLSASELLATLKFGSNAIFSSSNDLPTESDISKVVDRTRSEESSDGLLTGGAAQNAKDYDKDQELTDTRMFGGVDFRKLREEKEQRLKQMGGPKSKFLNRLKQEWKEVQTGESEEDLGKGKRNRKSRIVNLDGLGSGYGNKAVPVLAMNNYDLENGEPSVWRETKHIIPVVAKKQTKVPYTNQDFCQTCGDGGELIECPRCPVSVHSSCCGLHPRDFQCCSHHHCRECHKNASGAGGLLYRCQSCPATYCPDCLPNNEHTRFLGPDIPRFQKLGFTGNAQYIYIHCSKQCEDVSKAEFGFSEIASKPACPPDLDVSYAFGKDALDVKEIAQRFKEAADADAAAWMMDARKPAAIVASSNTSSNSSNRFPAPPSKTSPRKSPQKSPKKASISVPEVIDLS